MWKKIKSIIPTPYKVMRWYSSAQDTLHDFHRTHANTAFAMFVMMCFVSTLAYRADWGVLYGIELASTNNPNGAWWEATIFALAIQVLILYCGNMVIRLWMHGVHRQGEHYTQFKVQSALFAMGMGATLFLSWESDYAAKGKNIQAINDSRLNHVQAIDSIERRYEAKIQSLNRKYITDSTRAASLHATTLSHLQVEKDNIVSTREKQGRYDRAASYELSYTQKERAVLDSIKGEVAPIHDAHIEAQATARRERDEAKNRTDHFYTTELHRLRTDGEFNGAFTSWKNVILNLISIILSFLIQTFVRGSNAQFGENTTPLHSVPTVQKNRQLDEQLEELELDIEQLGKEMEEENTTAQERKYNGATGHNAHNVAKHTTAKNTVAYNSDNTATSDNNSVADVVDDETELFSLEYVQRGAGEQTDDSMLNPTDSVFELHEAQSGVDYTVKRTNGGSLAANQKTVWRKNHENGKIEVLYYGKNGNEWRDKSWHFSQRANRLDKAKKAGKNTAAVRNNHLWAGLHDTIIDLIEKKEKES